MAIKHICPRKATKTRRPLSSLSLPSHVPKSPPPRLLRKALAAAIQVKATLSPAWAESVTLTGPGRGLLSSRPLGKDALQTAWLRNHRHRIFIVTYGPPLAVPDRRELGL